jgi:hypothetical protein
LAIFGGVEVFEIEAGFDQVVFEVVENRGDLEGANFGDAGQGEEAGSFGGEIEITAFVEKDVTIVIHRTPSNILTFRHSFPPSD